MIKNALPYLQKILVGLQSKSRLCCPGDDLHQWFTKALILTRNTEKFYILDWRLDWFFLLENIFDFKQNEKSESTNHADFWKRKLSKCPSSFLPTDKARGATQTYNGKSIRVRPFMALCCKLTTKWSFSKRSRHKRYRNVSCEKVWEIFVRGKNFCSENLIPTRLDVWRRSWRHVRRRLLSFS